MLDILLAVKNNNMRKIPNYDPEHLEHLRKLLRGYTKGLWTSEMYATAHATITELTSCWWDAGSFISRSSRLIDSDAEVWSWSSCTTKNNK